MVNKRRAFLGQMVAIGLTPVIPSHVATHQQQAEPYMPSGFKAKNKVGFNLLLWSASVSEKMNPIADRIKSTGYNGVEVAMAAAETKPYVEFGKYLKGIDMEATCVFAVGKDEDPIHESKQVREKALAKMKWAVDRANDLGSKLICGPMHSAFAHFRRRPPSEEEYKYSAEVLHGAGEYAAKSNVIFAVEAINRFECYLCNTIEQLNKLVTLTDHPNIKPMLDTHHANIEEKDLSGAVNALKGSLAHVHISENDRGTPGDGHIHFDEVFSSLAGINYSGWLTIEAFSRNDTEFANAINVWREYSNTWDIVEKGFARIRSMQAKYKL